MKSFDSDAKFLGKALFPAIFGLPSFVQNNMLNILNSLGVTNPDPEAWYDLDIMTAFYQKIAKDFGPNTIFDLGKAIPDNAVFPPGIDSIESGLQLIDMAYNMNHTGYVGFYKMISHDLVHKKIIMQCYNPYPCDFDRGLFTAMARKFKTGIRVVVDDTQPSKAKGGDESWYIITYR
ncbi:MAG: hypothetical protein ACRBFS_06835 [Aureispira sp.]